MAVINIRRINTMTNNKKGGNEIAFRPQSIIEARFDLNRRQNDVLDLVFGMVGSDMDSEENTRYSIKVADAKKLYNLKDQSNAYKYLIDGVKKFKKGGMSGFQLKEDDDSDIWYAWFTRIAYSKAENEENSRIELDIHPDLKKMIIESKQGSYYRIEYSINLESKYSKRIYYYLFDRRTYQIFPGAEKGVFKVGVKELMEMLQCPKTYKYGNLKQTVLEKAHEEINGSTDIEFEYEEIEGKTTRGQRAIVEIQFRIKESLKRKEVIEAEVPTISEEISKILEILGCSTSEAKSILNTSVLNNRSWDEVLEVLDYTIKKKVENKVGYVLVLLKKGFVKPQSEPKTKKSNGFNNFDGRNYTKEQMSDFEKMALRKNLDNYECKGQMNLNEIPGVKPD